MRRPECVTRPESGSPDLARQRCRVMGSTCDLPVERVQRGCAHSWRLRAPTMEPAKAPEAGAALRIAFSERTTALGIAYVEARASFPSSSAPCTIYVVTHELHRSREEAEGAILRIARQQGWHG